MSNANQTGDRGAARANSGRGVLLSLAGSAIAGVMYYYATLLLPLGGLEIFGWRMVCTVPCMALFIWFYGEWRLVREVAQKAKERKSFFLWLCLSSFLLALQLWLFLWAPINNKALDVSLGYLLMPLVMVLCGRCIYRDKLAPYQKLAVACAVLGVANQVYQAGFVSLETLLVAFGFPAYFVVKKHIKTEGLGGLLSDMTLMLPAAVWIIWQSPTELTVFTRHPKLFFLLPLLGVISSMAVAFFVTAGRILPMSIFGLLSYMEPVLLVLVALILGERIPPGEMPTYALVFAAIALLALGGLREWKRPASAS
ncbi:MAG: EamA family transporter RarD [Deltaproteobacteria bacterium]|nr:EamA family transporter RarD [Deltaproteobacteria bacterium]